MAKPINIYWDSCAWLGLLNGEEDKRRELEIVYGHGKQGKYEIWTSALGVVECRRLADEQHAPKPLSEANEKVIRGIFNQPFVKVVPVAMDIAESARSIWRSTPKLKKYQDAVHLASALRWSIEIMHTYDNDDLLHLSGDFNCQNGRVLTICYPDETTDGPLFGKARNG